MMNVLDGPAFVKQAREQFRLLAEKAVQRAASQRDRRNTQAHRQAQIFKKNLEAVVKLQQMALAELRSRPLPDSCPADAKLDAQPN